MRYFLGDPHLGHTLVAEQRFPQHKGDSAVNRHDSILTEQLYELTRGDQLWVLGDISVGTKAMEDRALGIFKTIREATGAQVHAILGNHDGASAIHVGGWKRQRAYLEAFTSVQQYAVLKFNRRKVLLNHFPYASMGDGLSRPSVRYLEFRLPDVGFPLIHAHTHQPVAYYDSSPNQFCVSWDAHRQLVPEGHIQSWLDLVVLLKGETHA